MQDGKNLDKATIESFGSEWRRFDQSVLAEEELEALFHNYFQIFPWDGLSPLAEGFDMGCGSGRWAKLVAPRVGKLNCIDPSHEALNVAFNALKNNSNVVFYNESVDSLSLADTSQDFGYSLGVLHHIPNTIAALQSCTRLLKPGAPFLIYLYYRFDNRPSWFRFVWGMSNVIRQIVSRLPDKLKFFISDLLAAFTYWPMARLAWLIERAGRNFESLPLSFYRNSSFYTMRTDSRDRFGTPLEQRFTRSEIYEMMSLAGLKDIKFSESEPYWVAVGIKA